MTTVAEILKTKPDGEVHAIAPATSVLEAARVMAQRNIGALVVRDGEVVVGIVSERDCARKVVATDRAARQTSVREVMTAPVMYVRPETTSAECMALMTENRLRHLPVLDGARLSGLISIGDLVKDIISEQRFIIEQLEHYIAGDR